MEAQYILLITGLTEMFKRFGLPSKYLPVIAALIGGIIYAGLGLTFDNILMGVLQGLAASGVISVVDRRIQKAKGQ